MKQVKYNLNDLTSEMTVTELQNIGGGWKLLDRIGYALGETIGEAIYYGGQVVKEIGKEEILRKLIK